MKQTIASVFHGAVLSFRYLRSPETVKQYLRAGRAPEKMVGIEAVFVGNFAPAEVYSAIPQVIQTLSHG
jgi:hypothetical protein